MRKITKKEVEQVRGQLGDISDYLWEKNRRSASEKFTSLHNYLMQEMVLNWFDDDEDNVEVEGPKEKTKSNKNKKED